MGRRRPLFAPRDGPLFTPQSHGIAAVLSIIMADAREKPADHNRGAEILAVCGTMVALSLFTVVMRLWVRVRIVKHVGSDDWAIIAAMVCRTAPPPTRASGIDIDPGGRFG